MAKVLALTALLLLAGCGDRPEVRACKAYFEARYGVDMSFPKSSTHVLDESISYEELKRKFYPGKLSETEKLHLELARHRTLAIRTLGMNADKPQQVDGVGLNGIVCDFLLMDGKLYRKDSIVDDARAKANMASVRDLGESLGSEKLKSMVHKGPPGSECCMP